MVAMEWREMEEMGRMTAIRVDLTSVYDHIEDRI